MHACTAAVVAGAIVLVVIARFALPPVRTSIPPRDVDAAAERVVRDLGQMGISLPTVARFLTGTDRSARDTEVWALIQLPPEHFPRIRDEIRQFVARSRSRWVR